MRHRYLARAATLAAAAALVLGVSPASATTWYSGQRNHAGVSVEPAVDMATGHQIFLLTPFGAHTKANARAHAPLYLVFYPGTSTIPGSTLNCTPTNCDPANTFPPYGAAGLKGHDHLVGLPATGDWNVAWDVYPVFFTPQGFADGAINTRILTETQMDAAIAAGDLLEAPAPVFSFNCSRTSVVTYLHGTLYSG